MKAYHSLCDAAMKRYDFKNHFLFATLFITLGRAQDSSRLALEEFSLQELEGGEHGGLSGIPVLDPFSYKTGTQKKVPVLPRYDGPAGCWYTSLGDVLAAGYMGGSSNRKHDTDMQTFLLPWLCTKVGGAAESVTQSMRSYVKPPALASGSSNSSSSSSSSSSSPVYAPLLDHKHTSHSFRRMVSTLYWKGAPLHSIVALTGHAVGEGTIGANNTVFSYIEANLLEGTPSAAFLNGYKVDVTLKHYHTPKLPTLHPLLGFVHAQTHVYSCWHKKLRGGVLGPAH